MKKRKQKQMSVSQLRRLADYAFSRYIRARDRGICITCGKKYPQKKCQAGHYVSRVHNILRYNEQNVHCQCWSCNFRREGVKDEFTLKLISMYGVGVLYELNRLKKISKEFTREELWGIINEYQFKLKQLRRGPRVDAGHSIYIDPSKPVTLTNAGVIIKNITPQT